MVDIRVEGIGHSYSNDSDWALRPFHFTFKSGVKYALLGPSGCGKTTLLNILSGLLSPSTGKIFIGDADVTHKNCRHRNIAQVFQFPVVYESMTVKQNLIFPIRRTFRKLARDRQRVDEVIKVLELEPFLNLQSKSLSGFQKQLVSLGRALVRSDVNGILLDEPLTMVDPQRKQDVRRKIVASQEKFPQTMILVTHDQKEAMSFADEVIVLNQGVVLQSGSPHEIYNSPQDPFVAQFVGSPGMNILNGDIEQGNKVLLSDSKDIWSLSNSKAGSDCYLGIRPHHIKLGHHPDGFTIRNRVDDVELGSHGKAIRIASHGIQLLVPYDEPINQGDSIDVTLPFEKITIFSKKVQYSNLSALWS
ncbi:ABC transporter ATP-binding protein [Pseudobacteriovorax antillogorgiicola]|uniref:Carbohydrate ABC transporter ATP-binding protein, CUT1 family n=1 Tax=Pseudobacteriovorax antillogorgiicola TaxID=1513793 RepID=A0A1Y6CEW3_9BACT|nr:ABC transporter ATP-binding protein [Pseudobacteriovorax antillogorgiicola]TCS47626.1 carbohydrate ABC transporter ATP-binding protein (CUT1 family) [Pseudobacteriovorax antillogorgiicola]SMF59995.1 carbohydrate ABC transporter ATP-binding protein, CUT1 family [Pseudobacteriovorax antillogorgiicola]